MHNWSTFRLETLSTLLKGYRIRAARLQRAGLWEDADRYLDMADEIRAELFVRGF